MRSRATRPARRATIDVWCACREETIAVQRAVGRLRDNRRADGPNTCDTRHAQCTLVLLRGSRRAEKMRIHTGGFVRKLACLGLLLLTPALAHAQQVAQLFKKVSPSVVLVRTLERGMSPN